ncbi:MAG: hypothetical protein QOH61_1994 [Chloroflexota bacterium]|jgi:sporulation protein YlmC with PRC-barrel domain|nr:hypothetical protein [Chloroflexota bacterium]
MSAATSKSPDAPRTMLVAQTLIGVQVVAASGKKLGHVIDLELDPENGFRITAIELGRFGWLDRLHVLRPVAHGRSSSGPRVIPWSDVDRLAGRKLHLKTEAGGADT